jgi:hypothetical protein
MKHSKGIGPVRLPQPGEKLGGMKTMQEVGKERDIERFRDEKKKSKPEKQASATPQLSEFLAEQASPSPEEIERLRREKKRTDKPAPEEPSPAPEPEPKSNPERPKK